MSGWSLPSGGVNRKESFENAAKRELFEECGIEALSADFVETFVGNLHGASNRVEVFLIKDYKVTRPFVPNREIAECGWFSKNALPVEMAPKVRARLEAYLNATLTS